MMMKTVVHANEKNESTTAWRQSAQLNNASVPDASHNTSLA